MRQSREDISDDVYDLSLNSETEPSFCVKAKSTVSVLAYHLFDFLRICTAIQFLCGQYADQVFVEMDRYGQKPSHEAQESWKTSLPIMGGSAAAATIAKAINVYYSKRDGRYVAAQDYIYALFSSSIVFLAGDLFSSSGYMPVMPELTFILVSLLGVCAAMAIFFKIVTPISSDKIICVDEAAKAFPNPNRTERLLNAVGSVGHVASLSTFFWVLNHELNNGPAPLALWQKISLGLGATGSALFGAKTITDHPKSYLYFLMAVIFLNSSAMTYSSYSSLFIGPLKNEHPHLHNQESLIAFGTILSATVGSFSALTFQYDLKTKHESNLAVEKMISDARDKINGLFQRCRNCGKHDTPQVTEQEDDDELIEVKL